MGGHGPARALVKLLTAAGLLLGAGLPAHAQTDWFRPPADVGQSGARPAQPQRQQARPQPQRQQQARPQQYRQQQTSRQQQPRRQPPPTRSWTPLQPLIDLFSPEPEPPRYVAPSRPITPDAPASASAPVARTPAVPAAPAEPRGTVFETAAAARDGAAEKLEGIVLVLGDQNAAALAQGLADSFVADRPKVAVVAKSEDGSGLAPGGRFDWVRSGSELTARQEPNVVVMLAGANDLDSIPDGAQRAELLDERWRDLYGRRVDEFLLGIKLRGRPAVVVGLPPVDDAAESERRAQFNSFLKDRVERAGVVFVDVWDGFVDENGKFMMSGPDVDGQRRRLRTSDGIGFTRAGGRKLAFFVDKQLDDLLSREIAPGAGIAATERPSIIMLSGGAASGARTLAGGPVPTPILPAALQPPAESPAPQPARALVSGEVLPMVAGRVDDFRWPAGQPAAVVETGAKAADASAGNAPPPAAPFVVPPALPAPSPGSAGVGTAP